MSPVLNCIPSSPPSEGTYPNGENVVSDGSSQEISALEKHLNRNLMGCPNENSCYEESKRPPLTNNNKIPLNYKKSPSPNEGVTFEAPSRPWSSSPTFRSAERDQSVSPSSSGHRPSPCPPSRNSVSPDISSENSRIPSHASSEAHETLATQDSFRTFKMSVADIHGDIPFSFHENRLSADSFRLSNTFMGDPISPYLRLSTSPLNPFQTSTGFLGSPFFGASDPKVLLNNSGLGLFTQQLHHLNGISSNISKIPAVDLQRMSMQQLQFLHSHLQSLPSILHSSHYSRFPEHKNQLSMLVQARKHAKSDSDGLKREVLTLTNPKNGETSKPKARRTKHTDAIKCGKTSLEEGMEVDNYEDNDSDSDELLSVGSVSPPPNCQVTLSRPETDTPSDASLSASNCSSSLFLNRTANHNDSKKYSNSNEAVRLQNNLAKPANTAHRILKFSIDNILKSDFGSEEVVKKPKPPESKKEDERTCESKKKPESEQETSVDLPQDSVNSTSGSETPMLWPAWVYCTRYSDRPSSGPRTRRSKNKDKNPEEKRPRTAFSGDQLSRLKHEFAENRYLTERRRQDLARELGLNEAQIKIWFQNKRAKMKKARGEKNPLALQLMAQGLYNHSTVPLTKEEEEAVAAELSD